MKKIKAFMVFTMLVLLSGCTSFSNYQTAQSLGAGNSQFGVGLTFTDQRVDSDISQDSDYEQVTYFTTDLMFRTGVTQSFDAGVKIYVAYPVIGTAINGKYQFLDRLSFDMAIDLGVGRSGVEVGDDDDVTYMDYYSALLMTYNFSESGSATLTPKVVIRQAKSSYYGKSTNSFPGATLTFAFGKKAKIMPEIGYYSGKDRNNDNVDVIHFGIGFAFDL